MTKISALTPRLQSVARQCRGKSCADIGTDHAYIPIHLVTNGICKRAIASDIRQGPCDIASANVAKYALSDKIEIRLGAGLDTVKPYETDEIIIAGMGGEMIVEILKAHPDTAKAAKRLILQPMNNQYELRHYLMEHGFRIVSEDIAVEGFKVYNIMAAEPGESEPFERDVFYHLPPYLAEHAHFRALYAKKRREIERVINGLERSADCDFTKLEQYRIWMKELDYYEHTDL